MPRRSRDIVVRILPTEGDADGGIDRWTRATAILMRARQRIEIGERLIHTPNEPPRECASDLNDV